MTKSNLKPFIEVFREGRIFFSVFVLFTSLQIGLCQDLLLQPSRFNEYHSHQILSDSTIRIFGIVQQRESFLSGFSFYKDYNLYDTIQTPSWTYIGQNLYFTYGILDFNLLGLSDGSSIIGVSIFDCDYDPPGGILKISKDQTIEWFIDFNQLDIYGGVQHMVFTDSAIAVLVGGWGYVNDTFLVSRDGELLDEEFHGDLYEFTIETDFGFLVSKEDQLELLRPDFSVIESYTLEEIDTIAYLGNKQFLIQTLTQYYVLNDQLILQSIGISPLVYTSLWMGDGQFYVFQPGMQQVDVFDSLFNKLDSHPVLNGYTPEVGFQAGNNMLTTGSYFNGLNRWTYLQQTSVGNINFNRTLDIGVTDIEIADTILVEYYSLPFAYGGWYRHYDYINVEVTNYTNDTIHGYVIENEVVSNCFWCDYEYKSWEINDKPIPPQSSVKVELGPYLQPCTAGQPKDICLRTILPEYTVDANSENDAYCQPYSIIIPTVEVPSEINLQLFPIPASTELHILLETLIGKDYEILIYNSSGQIKDHLRVTESVILAVDKYPPGLYYIKLSENKGSAVKRFLVQR